MAGKRKQPSASLINEIERIPKTIRKLSKIKGLTGPKKRKKIADYVEGLQRQVSTRMRSSKPRDMFPPKRSGYQHWDFVLAEIRRQELKAILRQAGYRTILEI